MVRMELVNAGWRTSSYSGGNGECVEVAALEGLVGVRDSKDPTGPVLRVTPGAFAAFVRAVARGEFERG